MKVQELILSEEAHLENLEAVERIRNQAKKLKKDKTFPKHLRFALYCSSLTLTSIALVRLVTLFSNVKKIIDFHKTLFIVDLRNAEGRPEKVIQRKQLINFRFSFYSDTQSVQEPLH
mgnify:CR=1 FL=1